MDDNELHDLATRMQRLVGSLQGWGDYIAMVDWKDMPPPVVEALEHIRDRASEAVAQVERDAS